MILEKEKNDLKENLSLDKKNDLPAHIKMYEISGQEEITKHSLNRYLRSKKQDDKIKEQIKKSPESIIDHIKNTAEAEKSNIIKDYLKSSDNTVKIIAIGMIGSVPKDERTELFKKALKDNNVEIQMMAARFISCVSNENLSLLINYCLNNSYVKAQKIAISFIHSLPEDEKVALIEKCLNNDNIEIQQAGAEKIYSVQEEKKDFLGKKVLNNIEGNFKDADTKTKKVMIQMIKDIPEDKRTKLVVEGLHDNEIEIQKTSASLVHFLPGKDQSLVTDIIIEKITKGMNNPDIEIQKKYIAMIKSLPYGKSIQLTKLYLREANAEVQKKLIGFTAKTLIYISEKKERVALIKRCLENLNVKSQKLFINKIINL